MMVRGGLRGKVCAPSGGNPFSGPTCVSAPHFSLSTVNGSSGFFKASHIPVDHSVLCGNRAMSAAWSCCSMKHEGLLHVAQFSPFVQAHRQILIMLLSVSRKGASWCQVTISLLAPSPCLQVYSSFSLPLLIAWDFSESSFLPILPKGPWENHLYSITSSISSPKPKCS